MLRLICIRRFFIFGLRIGIGVRLKLSLLFVQQPLLLFGFGLVLKLGRHTFFLADADDPRLVVLVNYLAPTAIEELGDHRLILAGVDKNVPGTKPLANHRPCVLDLSGGYLKQEHIELGVFRIKIIRVEAVNVRVLRIEEKELRKVVPVGVKDAFAGRNVFLAFAIESGRPRHCTAISLIGLIVLDGGHQAAVLDADGLQADHIYHEINDEDHAERPDKAFPDAFPKCLRPCLYRIKIGLDVAAKFVREFDDLFEIERLPTERRKEYGEGRKILGETL